MKGEELRRKEKKYIIRTVCVWLDSLQSLLPNFFFIVSLPKRSAKGSYFKIDDRALSL